MATNLDDYKKIRDKQRTFSQKTASKDYKHRTQLLESLKNLLIENEEDWLDALQKDLNKPPVEAYASEMGVLLNEIEFCQKHLRKWLKSETKHRFLFTGYERVEISRRPYGSVLVLAPWNYPLQLALMPIIGTLAAGNSVVLKPSEHTQATSNLQSKLVPLYFKEEIFAVIEGDVKVAEQLTAIDWDFIFFTGSSKTGQKVYETAAKYLTPVLLELGGKNPCIVDETCLNDETVKQIVWGKFLNAGQSCIAPDTVYVSRKIYDAFLEKLTQQIEAFYGDNQIESSDYGRIINEQHFDEKVALLNDGHIYYGGKYSREALYIQPTVLVDVKPDSALATEEIFGPILSVVAYDDLKDLLTQLRKLSEPLVTYIFSQNDQVIQQINHGVESSALSRNQVIFHSTNPYLPFGGKGRSGLGRYHGKASFEAFSYVKPIYTKKSFIPILSQYPPYSKKALSVLRKLRKFIF